MPPPLYASHAETQLVVAASAKLPGLAKVSYARLPVDADSSSFLHACMHTHIFGWCLREVMVILVASYCLQQCPLPCPAFCMPLMCVVNAVWEDKW